MAIADPTTVPGPPAKRNRFYAWRTALLGSRKFQSLAARIPGAAGMARRDGERLFDLTAGFLHSQVLLAFVQFDLPRHLSETPKSAEDLAQDIGLQPERMQVLCQAAAALGLLNKRSDGRFGLDRLGAALPGVPGLADMIRHHDVLYRDVADPVGFFRDGSNTELARFWPYVFGAEGPIDPDIAERYSGLMAESQKLVAEEALRHIRFDGVSHLMDVGGGTGVFLAAVGAANPNISLHLFDLPAVVSMANRRFETAGLADRAQITPGNFRSDTLPQGADAISLVRVLYDHGDDTIRMLLAKVHAALPDSGRIIIAEPMSGGDRPSRAGDAYFALYCMAMGTGRARSAAEISALLEGVGFASIREHRVSRPFVTSVIEARKI